VYPVSCELFKQNRQNINKLICVENNTTGQFAKLLKMEEALIVNETVLKFNGSRAFYLSELVIELERRLTE